MGFLRSLRPFDVAAVLIAVGAGVASLIVWDYGKVDIGMTLAADDHGLTDPTGVIVADVTPDGNAMRHGFYPLSWVIDLTTISGREVERTEPIDAVIEGPYVVRERAPWDILRPQPIELSTREVAFAAPSRPVPSADIETVTTGEFDRESGWIYTFNQLDRNALESSLFTSIWALTLGSVLGLAVWRFLAHGLGGDAGRERAVLVGAGAATPFLLLPVVQVGTAIGIYAGYLLPISLSMLLALSLALGHPDRSWRRSGIVVAVVGAAVASLMVARYMTSPAIDATDRGVILALTAGFTLLPAAMVVSASQATVRERASHASLALVPAAAMTLFTQPVPDVALPFALVGILLGWQLLPVERVVQSVSALSVSAGKDSIDGRPDQPIPWRDRTLLTLFAIVTLGGLFQLDAWATMLALAVAAAVGMAVRAGFFGAWRDAAVPLAVATGIPIALISFRGEPYGSSSLMLLVSSALAALGVAHVLARRFPASLAARLLAGSAGVAVVAVLLVTVAGSFLGLALVGAIALVPGVPLALSESSTTTRGVRERLETMVIALTPGMAATALVGSVGPLLIIGWLLVVAAWRQLTLKPLIGLAQRTQLQRDVAVAAAETERARLAADLHDDALQQLTMLVRTLDEGGQKEAAAEAREIATKLRSVVGDLRLPILDDLGAGAALEWLVERVEPLAGGPVKLERSDETRPPANVELAVFRVAQEALTNAIKHGKPPIAVRYDVRTDGRVTLAIDDAGDGIGTEAADEAPAAGHFGLVNMQQRAEQIGALLDVRRWPAGGTRVALEWRPQ